VQRPHPIFGAHAVYLEAYLYDPKESLWLSMAGCSQYGRGKPNSRLQRQSAILNVFSEASENPTAWVFYLDKGV
jgi:hypothetical protein